MSSSLEKLRHALRRLGPSEQLVRETRSALSSKIESLLAKARELEEKRVLALKEEARRIFSLRREIEEVRKRKPRKPKPEEVEVLEERILEKPKLDIFRKVLPIPPLVPPKIYIDTVVFLNVFKKEHPYAKSSERVLKAVEVGCLRGLSSSYSKVEISLILKNKELCKIAFDQINRWKVEIIDVTERVMLNLLIVRNYMQDINDLIHASTALTEHVEVLTTRNIEDFFNLQRYFLVWPPEKVIEEFKVIECTGNKMKFLHHRGIETAR